MNSNKIYLILFLLFQVGCSDPFDLTRTDIISDELVFDDPVLADAFLFDLYDRAQFHIKSGNGNLNMGLISSCLLYTSPSPRDGLLSRMPSSA